MPRIIIVGTTGTGKTTLGRQIARMIEAPLIDMDDLFFLPEWKERTERDFSDRVDAATRGESWVICGNYSRVRDLLWSRADTLIWVDYGFGRTFFQLMKRTLRRCFYAESVCGGNKEDWRRIFSRSSIILWFLTTWKKNRLRYEEIFNCPEKYSHLTFVRLRSPEETQAWLERFSK